MNKRIFLLVSTCNTNFKIVCLTRTTHGYVIKDAHKRELKKKEKRQKESEIWMPLYDKWKIKRNNSRIAWICYHIKM